MPNHKKSAELVFLNLILTLISYRKIYQGLILLNVWRKS
ncbi:Positive transcriptional regulator, MutR family [Streptococcus macedonicus]|nr:Positive transcriptional regulator, MutR family [Streptococcus macedonicus]